MSKDYDEYLESHITAVAQAAEWIVDNLDCAGELTDEERRHLLTLGVTHDESKFSEEEYVAYDRYFYGKPDVEAFERAWLHHIHANRHHWQHWLLVNDEGGLEGHRKIKALEMPTRYALEMVADWWSFSWRGGNLLEVFEWYSLNKWSIILHPKTRKFVESVLDDIRAKLEIETEGGA